MYFLSFLSTEIAQADEILPRWRQGPFYSALSILWLLMTWRCKKPGHYQPWCCSSDPGIFWKTLRGSTHWGPNHYSSRQITFSNNSWNKTFAYGPDALCRIIYDTNKHTYLLWNSNFNKNPVLLLCNSQTLASWFLWLNTETNDSMGFQGVPTEFIPIWVNCYWWQINIPTYYGLVETGNKPL